MTKPKFKISLPWAAGTIIKHYVASQTCDI